MYGILKQDIYHLGYPDLSGIFNGFGNVGHKVLQLGKALPQIELQSLHCLLFFICQNLICQTYL